MPKTIYKKIIDFTIPYTYYLEWTTGMKYYGVRHSRDSYVGDIMITYFTSSKYVKEYITENGNPIIIRVDKCFETKEDALEYEHQFLVYNNVAKDETWLNKTNGSKKFHCISHTPETKAQMSIDRSGEKSYWLGKTHTPEAKKKVSGANSGRVCTDETRKKLSIAALGRVFTEETKAKMSVAKKGIKNPKSSTVHLNEHTKCIHCGMVTNLGNITHWHNDNCKHKK